MNTPDAQPIALACVADDAYAMPLAVTLASALAHLAPERRLTVHVVDGGLTDSNRDRIARSLDPRRISLHWLEPSHSRLARLPLWGRMSVNTYARLLAAELLPGELDKVLWLDSDMVVRADLGRLWDVDMNGRHILAAQDMIVPFVSSPLGVARYKEIGLDKRAKYFNAGVMAMDLALWRRDDIAEKTIAYLRDWHDSVVLWDQEGLNVVLADKWGEIDLRWNQNAGVCGRPFFDSGPLDPRAYSEAVRDPWIVHFTGNLKPWMIHNDNPTRALFFHHVDMTDWKGWRPKRTWRSVALGLYENCRGRRWSYPAEKYGLRLWRKLTRRTTSTPER